MAQDCPKMARDDTKMTPMSETASNSGPKNPDSAGNQRKPTEPNGNQVRSHYLTFSHWRPLLSVHFVRTSLVFRHITLHTYLQRESGKREHRNTAKMNLILAPRAPKIAARWLQVPHSYSGRILRFLKVWLKIVPRWPGMTPK